MSSSGPVSSGPRPAAPGPRAPRDAGAPRGAGGTRDGRAHPHDAFQARTAAAKSRLAAIYESLPEHQYLSGGQRWLYDNDYLLWRSLSSVTHDMPRRFFTRLRVLPDGSKRIESIMAAYLASRDGRLGMTDLLAYLEDHQTTEPLDLAELWAVPTMLRLLLAERAIAAPDDESQVATAVLGLHEVERQDWTEFVEAASLVERGLARDPAGVYLTMDAGTRDRYRSAVERLALRTGRQELEVCEAAIALAEDAAREARAGALEAPAGPPVAQAGALVAPAGHVGAYLVGRSRSVLESRLGYRPRLLGRIRRTARRAARGLYVAASVVVAAAIAAPLVAYGAWLGGGWRLWLLAVLLAVPVWLAAEVVVHRLVAAVLPPRVLPKLDLARVVENQPVRTSEHDPRLGGDYQTLVAVPCILSDAATIDALFERLERHYVASAAGPLAERLAFALLADLPDAEHEVESTDAVLVDQAFERLGWLRKRHPRARFMLLTRRRLFNDSEDVWMGWERKRGKLMELNSLILRGEAGTFAPRHSDTTDLNDVRYVITLDADSLLPPGAAAELVGTLAHPLNRARFDAAGRLVDGYTVLQPRVEVTPESANRTPFSRLIAGSRGLDLYSLAVSDAYMDLFGEGLYAGKGIYDVAAFDASLRGAVPDNTVLSHDLFEGGRGRAGLVTDVVLFESVPTRFLAYLRRQQRWTRGDWQLLPFLRGGGLSWVAWWAASQNLVRSAAPPAYLLALVAAFITPVGATAVWVAATVTLLGVPYLVGMLNGWLALRREAGRGTSGAGAGVSASDRRGAQGAGTELRRWAFEVMVLPVNAVASVAAIAVTLHRVFVSREHLLRWRGAARESSDAAHRGGLGAWSSAMLAGPAAALGSGMLIAWLRPGVLAALTPLLLAWLLSPAIAWLLSRSRQPVTYRLTATERRDLRKLARRTWLYFERFVGPEDHWLPPDHFQESPGGALAHRTSPTNIGLMLASTVGAYDFGFLGARSLVGRLSSSLTAMDHLVKHRGHLLNWYDTKTLQPLAPRYVSTVDTGNLLASLVAVKGGCVELQRHSVNRWAALEGIVTMLDLYRESVVGLPSDTTALTSLLDATSDRLLAAKSAPGSWWGLLRDLEDERLPKLDTLLLAAVRDAGTASDHQHLAEVALWSGRLHRLVQETARDLVAFMPWLDPTYTDLVPVLADLPAAPTVADLAAVYDDVERRFAVTRTAGGDALLAAVAEARALTASVTDAVNTIATTIDDYLENTDFEFLYDRSRHVFRIGFDVDNARLDAHAYDLFASEARLASFLAVAYGQAPVTHWLHLSRPYAVAGGERVMLSWSGTMFEYLTPSLFMPTPADSVTATALRAAVDRHVAYGSLKGVPWGVSESGYALTDAQENYQYYAFGVPDLALARVSDEDLVIAPYASLMALSVDAQRSLANLERLTELGALGRYGFYEALDFSPGRVKADGRPVVVRSFMAHHHGMTLLAIGNVLCDDVFVERFRHDVRVRSVEYLLHEGVPSAVKLEELPGRRSPAAPSHDESMPDVSWDVPPRPAHVHANAVSNGDTTVLTTTGGGGFTRWKGLDVTRWRSDPTTDEWGEWLYVQDLRPTTGDRAGASAWSATRLPTGVTGNGERVTFTPHATEVGRTVDGILSRLSVSVAPEHDVAIKTLTLTNTGDQQRHLAVTSYGEVVLAEHGADVRHPAFGNMFIESSFEPDTNALLFRRQPRSPSEKPVYLLHAMVSQEPFEAEVEYDSNRRSFIGRGGDVRDPAGLSHDALAADVGSTLDPIFALRARFVLQPHRSRSVAAISVMGGSRREVLATAHRYRSWQNLQQAGDEARITQARRLLRTGTDPADMPAIQGLLSRLLYPSRHARAPAEHVRANRLGQRGLWAHGISGDHPILLVRVAGPGDLDAVQLALTGHRRWREQGFTIDLVVLNQGDGGYRQATHDALRTSINRSGNDAWLERPGGIFLLSALRLEPDEVTLLEAVARVVIGSGRDVHLPPTSVVSPEVLPGFTASNPELLATYADDALRPPTGLEFDNGFGGFAENGRAYVIYGDEEATETSTPAPWVNVIANPGFGTMITEVGSSTTWAVNSSENRLTPWSNDAVRDPTGEALYLRDEETGAVWTPTPRPLPAATRYLTTHRAGSTSFRHRSNGLDHDMTVFVPPDAPVKVVRLRLRNRSPRQRRLTATYYAQVLLGTTAEATAPHVVAEYDAPNRALLVRNAFNQQFGEQVAFLTGSHPIHGLTTDRGEFLGREGGTHAPAALRRIGLSGELEPGADPCAVLQFHVDLEAGGDTELFFVLGRAQDTHEARELVAQWRRPAHVEAAWRATNEFWDELLGAVQVATPDRSLDVLLNRWLLYQAVSCRLWGRTAFYQSSGAFGFRDQMQDALALVHVRPRDLRTQLVRAAAHQFEAGDVLHWWHPPGGQGVRTRFSDDLAWLPYATAHYLEATGDFTVLDEVVPYLEGPELAEGVDENYDAFQHGEQTGSLYEHCMRALERACTTGPHGLPLIGSGDWNDGMSRVGIGGRGESVWLAWFLIRALTDFAHVCALRGEDEKAAELRRRAEEYRRAVEAHAWDGEWYVRAFYDDGTPLGSHLSDEPKIDAIAQAWSVLSRAGDEERSQRAMRSARELLVSEDDSLVLLLKPPFDRGSKDPGYIKSYPPGVRENGGQYTHAATWTLWALAELGDGDDATFLYSMINPANLTATSSGAQRYRVEPYAVAADVYGAPPHTGTGGWTWYTGSASWYYRLGLERLLGITRHGDTLRIDPRVPLDWSGFTVDYRFGASRYRIEVKPADGPGDGAGGKVVTLVDDGEDHRIIVTPRMAAATV